MYLTYSTITRMQRCALIWLVLILSATAANALDDNVPVAKVNDVVITRTDLHLHLDMRFNPDPDMDKEKTEALREKTREQVVQDLISRELLYEESREKDIDIDDAVVDRQFLMLQARFGSERTFLKALHKMGFSADDMKFKIRQGMAVRQLIQTQYADTIPTAEKELQAYYNSHIKSYKRPERIRASHILMVVKETDTTDQKLKIREALEKLRKRILQGEDFAELAKKFSQGPSAHIGGELGYFSKGQMVAPFEKAAFALEPGQVSDIVETPFGYHLIKVTDRKPPSLLPYAEARSGIVLILRERKLRKAMLADIDRLKQNARIEIFPEAFSQPEAKAP